MAVGIHTEDYLFKSLAANVHSSIIAFDEDGTVLYVNEQFLIHSGIKKETIIGENIRTLAIENDQLSECVGFVQKCIADKKNGTTTASIITKNKVELTLNLSFNYLGDNGSNRVASYCISDEITSTGHFMNFLFAEHIRYQEYMNDMPLLICRYTPNGTITFYNKFFYSVFGDEKKSPRNIIDDFSNFEAGNEYLRKILFPEEEDKMKNFRFTFNMDGGKKWFLGTVHIFEDNSAISQHRELQLVALDVTAQMAAELEIVNSQHQFHQVIDAIDDIILTFDSDLCIRLTNKYAQKIAERYNCIDKIAIGSKVKELIPGVEYPANQKILETFVTNEPSSCVYAYNLNGNVFFIEHRFFPIMSKGEVKYVLVLHHDQTNAHLNEMKIMKNEMILNTTVENAVVGILNIDADDTITFANSPIEQLTGYAKEEMIGSKFHDKIHEQDRDQTVRHFRKLISGEISNYTLVKRYIRKDGSIMWIEAYTSACYDNDKKFITGISILLDITKRMQYEKKLKQDEENQRTLNATKDKFFSIIAHDLKNPFATISLLAQNSSRKSSRSNSFPASSDNTMDLIKEASDGGYNLLSNLLTWAKDQTGHTRCRPEKINLSEIADLVIKTAIPAAMVKSVSIYNQIPSDITVFADKNMLRTIFRNLISNAIKFSYPGGTVTCKASETGKFAEISVIDKGVGIAPEISSKLFSFEGAISTKGTNNEDGTGLGLIICQEFVKKHGGSIWVTSAMDKGSIFSFTLPVSRLPNKKKGE